MQISFSTIRLQPVIDKVTIRYGINLFVLRLDLIHPHISGNKWFKLNYNLQEAKKQNKDTLLTFGGAYSNHIAATAAAGKEFGFNTIGIIRGEEYNPLNKTLQFATDCGMKLHYLSREEYRNKNISSFSNLPIFQSSNYYLIPEGGANELGVLGAKDILKNITIEFDYVTCPCGTGTTFAGLVLSLKKNQQAVGFQILKANNYIQTEISKWLVLFNERNQSPDWQINQDYHFGGYAKTSTELDDFIHTFELENDIPLEPIYSGKMMYGLYDMIKKGYFEKGKTIVAIHTGGLQGKESMENKFIKKKKLK